MPPIPPPADPTRAYSFTDHSTNYPTTPQPGDRLDEEIDRSNEAIADLKAFVRQVIADDGTIKPGLVGDDQLDTSIGDQIVADTEAAVQPLVDSATSSAASALDSKNAAFTSKNQAAASATLASGYATDANASKIAAATSESNALTYRNTAQTHATNALNSANTATGASADALNYAELAQLWSEYLQGNNSIPSGQLAAMGVTGAHWSARFWALQAAIYAAAAGNPAVPLAPKSLIGNLTGALANPTSVPVQETANFAPADDAAIPTSKAVADRVASQIAAHEAAADPHPTYTTAAELVAALAGYQPLDSDLTAIAALTTTAFGRGLLELANAAAGRTALDVDVAGTAAGLIAAHEAAANPHPDYTTTAELSAALASYLTTAAAASSYQPLDSDLTAIAALTTTTFGRSVLTQADAAAARTLFGLANAAYLNASQTWTAGQTPLTAALTDGATVNWNCDNAQVATLTATAARTIAAPTNQVANRFYGLVITNSGGAFAHAFNVAYIFDSNDGTPASFPAGSRLHLTFRSDGTNMREWGRRVVAS